MPRNATEPNNATTGAEVSAKELVTGLNQCTNEEYHADKKYLSSSKLKTILKDPAQFYNEHILGQSKAMEGGHLDEGSAVHTMLLEPELFATEYIVWDGWRKQGKVWDDFASENPDKCILSAPQNHRVQEAVVAVKKRPELLAMLKGGFAEQSVCTTLLDVPVKARADYVNVEKGYILDIKTTRHSAGHDMFKFTVAEYAYQLSAALYCQIFYEQYRKLFDFYFGVYSKADKQWDIYKASSSMLTEGHAMTNKALVTYKRCLASGIWSIDALQRDAVNFTSEYEILEI